MFKQSKKLNIEILLHKVDSESKAMEKQLNKDSPAFTYVRFSNIYII